MPRFVDLETARRAPGLRLVVLAGVPSVWSEAAKGVFQSKGLAFVAVRLRLDSDDVRAWTGVSNAPVVVFDDQPPLHGWSDILALAERLAPSPSLLPAEPDAAAGIWDLCHAISGQGGLMWSARLLLIHASLTSDGREGFPLGISRALASRYGYAPEAVGGARVQVRRALAQFDALLTRAGATPGYLHGQALSAADIHLAAATACLSLFPDDLCPVSPRVRQALGALHAAVRDALPASLLEHRDFVYSRHLELPIQV